MRARALSIVTLAALAAPAFAQAPATPLQSRADQLLALLGGKATSADLFAPSFLAQGRRPS